MPSVMGWKKSPGGSEMELRHPHFSRQHHARNGAPDLERNLFERFDGSGFVVFYVEDGIELGDLEQVIDLLGEIQQLEFAALILGGSEGADQFADAGAIDVINFGQVQHDLLVALAKQVAHRVAKDDAAFAEGDAAAAIHNGNAIHLPTTNLHGHWEASLPPAVGPWTCLMSLSSVPAEDGRISTTSINERIRKIPRPEVLSKFSGARGLGILLRSIPRPWSRMVMIRSLPVRSKARMTFFSGAYALPCNTALTAPSRTAMEICMTSSSAKPSSVAIRVAFSSALSIVSNEESSVYETRCSVMAIDDVYVRLYGLNGDSAFWPQQALARGNSQRMR